MHRRSRPSRVVPAAVAIVGHGRLRVVGLHVGRLHVVVVRAVGVVVARLAGGAGQAAGTGVAGDALRWKRSSL